MRYQDPEGDYGRQKRQREVIQKVVEKVLSLNSISHYQSILKALSTNMQTNIDLSAKSIPSLLGYKDSFKTIETQQLKGEGEMATRRFLSNCYKKPYVGNAESF